MGPEKSWRAHSLLKPPSVPDRPALAQAIHSSLLPPVALAPPVDSHTCQAGRPAVTGLAVGRAGYRKWGGERWHGEGTPWVVTPSRKCMERVACCGVWPGLFLMPPTLTALGWEKRVRLRRTTGRGVHALDGFGTQKTGPQKLRLG